MVEKENNSKQIFFKKKQLWQFEKKTLEGWNWKRKKKEEKVPNLI